MEYQIASIDPGTGDRDLIVEVHHWHNDFGRALRRAPDWIEHHWFVNLPSTADVVRPVRNQFGHYIKLDGTPMLAFVEVDGRWERYVPPLEEVQTETIPGPTLEELVEEPIRRRAAEVRDRHLQGIDRIPNVAAKISGRQQHMGRRDAKVRALVGRARRI